MFKIIGNIDKIGNKALNLYKLYKFSFLVPYTLIIEYKLFDIKFLNKLNKTKKYIIRPSFLNEDLSELSFAGKYNSIGPLNFNDLISFFNKIDFYMDFGGDVGNLGSLIIQEFIDTSKYGVLFTRNPANPFLKGFFETGTNSDSITKTGRNNNVSIGIILKSELLHTGRQIEKKFNYPQDIEFAIKNDDIVLLQTRNITTFNNLDFFNHIKITGLYSKIDNGEFTGNGVDFTYYFIKIIYPDSLFLGQNIFFKQSAISFLKFLFSDTKNSDFKEFLSVYKKYLLLKFFYIIFSKIFFFFKHDLKILSQIYKDYFYTFNLDSKSNLDICLDFSGKIPFATKFLIYTERKKRDAFKIFETNKKTIRTKKIDICKDYFNNEYLPNNLFFYKGQIINKITNSNKFDWIYKGEMSGFIVDLNTIKYSLNEKQILIVDDMNFDLYNISNYLSGVIIKKGGYLSHNSIVLRELKIPSVINYKEFDNLILGNYFNIN